MTERPKLLTPEERVLSNVTTSFGAAALMVKADRADILAKAKTLALTEVLHIRPRAEYRQVIPIDDLAALLEGR